MPCLMTDEHTYTFAISKTGGGGPPTFYCLILSKDHSTPEDIELLQTILSASTAFSGNQEGAERNEGLGEEDQQQGSEGAQSAASWSSFSSSPALNKVSESFKRGGSVLGSQLLKAASFAKEKTGAVLTEERKQQISQTAASVSASVAAGARKVAEASKSAGIKVYEKVKESEALAKFGAGTKSALSVAYKEMQKASVAVVALVREAANKAARATSGEPSSPPIPQSAPPQAS